MKNASDTRLSCQNIESSFLVVSVQPDPYPRSRYLNDFRARGPGPTSSKRELDNKTDSLYTELEEPSCISVAQACFPK